MPSFLSRRLEMKELRKYDIQFHGLSIGNHEFIYSIDKKFFDLFQFNEAEDFNILVNLNFEKQSSMVVLNFQFEGTLVFNCDLCLELFNYPFNHKQRQIIKFGEEEYSQTEEIDVIPLSSNYINAAKYIYEFIALSMPSKRVHPSGYCNESMLSKLQTIKLEENLETEEIKDIDPRWEALKKLRDK